MTAKRIHNGLNHKEQKVLAQFVRAGRPHPMTLADLAEVFAYVGKAKANSWVRNSIRRPVYMGLLEPTSKVKGSGTYQITKLGREMVKKGLLEAKTEAKAAPKAKKAAKVATPTLEEDLKTLESGKSVEAIVAALNAPAIVPEVVKPEVVIEAKLVEVAKVEVAPGLTVVEVAPAPAPEPKPATPAAPWVEPTPAQ
jgi:hypothetical protein